MSTQSINRQPAGTPTGGQFAAGSTGESGVSLADRGTDAKSPSQKATEALVSVHSGAPANHSYLVSRGVLSRLDHQTFRLAHTEMQAASNRALPEIAAGWVKRDAAATPRSGLTNSVPQTSAHHNLSSAFSEAVNPFNGRDEDDNRVVLHGVFNQVASEAVDHAYDEHQRCQERASDFRAGRAQWGDDEDDDESYLDDADDDDRDEQAANMWERHSQLVADQLVHRQLSALNR